MSAADVDLDLIVLATATPDRPAPATACAVQEKIGARNAVAFDIAAVCSGALVRPVHRLPVHRRRACFATSW